MKILKQFFKLEINPNRIYGLDILRALAIWFVLYAHSLTFLQEVFPIKYLRWFMFDGVSIFFTLSGFLIGGILLKNLAKAENPDFKFLKDFWQRRWLRTLPNYFLILTALVIYHSLFRDLATIPIWKYFLFIQNLGQPHPMFYREAWSLSIEEWFYIITPLGLIFQIKTLKLSVLNALLITALGLITFSTLYRVFIVLNIGAPDFSQYNTIQYAN